MDMQEQRRLCTVPNAVVCHGAMEAHFLEHVVRAMGNELGSDEALEVRVSFFDIVDDPGGGDPLGDYENTWMVTWQRGPVLKGRYRVCADNESFWGSGKDYRGEVLTDPTWEDLTVEAERLIRCTGDSHHVFLEHFTVLGTDLERLAAVHEDGVLDLELFMGS